MRLNPFEDKKNEYDLREILTKEDLWVYEPKQEYKDLFGEFLSYEVLVKAIDTSIKWHILKTGSYQGDYWYIGEKDDKIYFIDIGYGSCSGCDSLLAREYDIDGLVELQDEIKRKIREFDNILELVEWIHGSNEWWFDEKYEILGFINKEFDIL